MKWKNSNDREPLKQTKRRNSKGYKGSRFSMRYNIGEIYYTLYVLFK